MVNRRVVLTDEELSRVLSEADIGRLDHGSYGPRLELGMCGCVAGTAMNVADVWEEPDGLRACSISDAVMPVGFDCMPGGKYPARNATEMLRYLESRGVA